MKKVLYIILVLLLALFALWLVKGSRRPVLRMVTEAQFPPYEFYENREIVGIDVEVVRRIAEELGYTLVIQDTSFDYVIQAVLRNEADVAASGITITPDRLKKIDFSYPYSSTEQCVTVQKKSKIAAPAQLKGAVVGVQRDTTGDAYVAKNFQEPARFANGEMALNALSAGKLDAVVLDREAVEALLPRYDNLKVLADPLTWEAYGFGFRKQDKELLRRFNACLKRMIGDGTLEKIFAKYNARALQISQKMKNADKVLTMVSEPSYPPFIYTKNGHFMGIEMEIMEKVAKALDSRLVVDGVGNEDIFNAIQYDKAEVAGSALEITQEREKDFLFTLPYATTEFRVLVKKQSKFQHENEVKGRRVGVLVASSMEEYVSRHYGEPERFGDMKLSVDALLQGKLDALLMDGAVAEFYHREHPEDLRLLPEKLASRKLGFALKKDNTELREKINAVLEKLEKDGSLEKIRAKYKGMRYE